MDALISEITRLLPVYAGGAEAQAPKVLLYVDDDVFRYNVKTGEPNKYMPEELQKVLQGEGYKVELYGREKTLDDDLLAGFAEVWFFLASSSDEKPLSSEEVNALRRWMDGGGGILITGDHAEVPSEQVDGEKRYRGLGRAVGAMVPRARYLREWEDKPGILPEDESNNSTWTPGDEFDAKPQRLLIRRPVHPVFCGQDYHIFPDHLHEGVVRAPILDRSDISGEELERWRDEWLLSKNPPDPEIIAEGINWSRGDVFPLLAAWDGQSIEVGRILADSSWHHYVRENLKMIGKGRERIFALYLAEAWWLLPPTSRVQRMAQALARVIELPRVADYEHNSVREIGRVAMDGLQKMLSCTALSELMQTLWSDPLAPEEGLRTVELQQRLLGTYISRLRGLLEDGVDREALRSDNPGGALHGIVREVVIGYAKELRSRADRLESIERFED